MTEIRRGPTIRWLKLTSKWGYVILEDTGKDYHGWAWGVLIEQSGHTCPIFCIWLKLLSAFYSITIIYSFESQNPVKKNKSWMIHFGNFKDIYSFFPKGNKMPRKEFHGLKISFKMLGKRTGKIQFVHFFHFIILLHNKKCIQLYKKYIVFCYL